MDEIYDSFISYRREETKDVAQVIKFILENSGRKTFLDTDNIGAGKWTEAIEKAITNCTNFIFIRSQKSLDRCKEEGDVVLKELSLAIEKKKKILLISYNCTLPIPKDLPGPIKELYSYQEIAYDTETSRFAQLLTKKMSSQEEYSVSDPDKDFVIENGVLTKYTGNATDVTIPDGVREIAREVFKDQTRISSLVLNPDLEKIGDSAFERCNAIRSIKFPEHLKFIGAWAFARCYALSSADFDNMLETISSKAFAYCYSLMTVRLGSNISYIDPSAFDNCGKLKEFIIDEENTHYKSVDGILFNSNLTEVIRCPENYEKSEPNIPRTVEVIGKASFSRCTRLLSVDIPEGVTAVKAHAFEGCRKLYELKLHSSIHDFDLSAINEWGPQQTIEFAPEFDAKLKQCLINQIQLNKKNINQNLGEKFCLIKTMFESVDEARNMARDLLDRHLIVSGQIKQGVESVYYWDGKIDSSGEIELTCFTESGLYKAVESYIKEKHSYEVAEIISLPINEISEEFGAWIKNYVENKDDRGGTND